MKSQTEIVKTKMVASSAIENHGGLAVEYIVVGAGPAGICAIAKILELGVSKEKIIWIDPNFEVGDFGTKWKNVPGNTTVDSYQKVNREIYKIISRYITTEFSTFEIDSLPPTFACSLKIAAEPMQEITNNLLKIIHSEKTRVSKISRSQQGWSVTLENDKDYITKRVILATGVRSKLISLPSCDHSGKIINITHLPVENVVDAHHLEQELKTLNTVAIIGSSHTAALAAMHLLEAGVKVIQFMKTPYRFAQPISLDDITNTLYDNTGLKGRVAEFTKELIANFKQHGKYFNQIEYYLSNDNEFKTHLSRCSHVLFAIGFEPLDTLKIEDYFQGKIEHDPKTTIIRDGIFGFGIAYPLQVTTCGVKENSVGYGKFWLNLNNNILAIWQAYTADSCSHSPDINYSETELADKQKESCIEMPRQINNPSLKHLLFSTDLSQLTPLKEDSKEKEHEEISNYSTSCKPNFT